MKLFKNLFKSANNLKNSVNSSTGNPITSTSNTLNNKNSNQNDNIKIKKINIDFSQYHKVENPFGGDNTSKYFRTLIDDALGPEDIFKNIRKQSQSVLPEQLEKDNNK